MKSLKYLTVEFKDNIEELLSLCGMENVCMVPYNTLRTPIQQVKYWRQSRSWNEIKKSIDMLKEEKAYWLSEILFDVGPQYGRWATDSLPGLSWHQWGEAVDCFSLIGGKANWNANHNDYNIYARTAEHLKLVPGHYWPSKDSVHVQMRRGQPTDFYSLEKISEMMEDRFNKRRL